MQTIDAELVRDFVIAGHGNLAVVRKMLAATPDLLNMAHEWAPGDMETAVQAASHVGNREIAFFLLGRGAPNAIYTAAMLGDRETVATILAADSSAIHQRGAHSIPLLAHSVFSGDVELVRELISSGATEGSSLALANSVSRGDAAMVTLLLADTTPDLAWKNYLGQTPLEVALAQGHEDVAELLRIHGAADGPAKGGSK